METDYQYYDNGSPKVVETTITDLNNCTDSCSKTYTYNHNLDTLGRTSSIILNNKEIKSYTYDAYNRASSIMVNSEDTDPQKRLTIGYEYDNLTHQYSYDEVGFMTSHEKNSSEENFTYSEVDIQTGVSSWNIGSEIYLVDSSGRVTNRKNKVYNYGPRKNYSS